MQSSTVCSTDWYHCFLVTGMIEYWTGSNYTFPQDVVTFKLKLDTDLYALAKAKTSSTTLEIGKDGSQFATWSASHPADCILSLCPVFFWVDELGLVSPGSFCSSCCIGTQLLLSDSHLWRAPAAVATLTWRLQVALDDVLSIYGTGRGLVQ